MPPCLITKLSPGAAQAMAGWLWFKWPGSLLNVVRSFETYGEAKAEADRLASLEAEAAEQG